MTIETASKFAKQLFEDEKLQGEVEAAIKGVDDSMEKAKRVVAIGKKHGFEFTPAEALIVKTTIRQTAVENKLLDDQLTDQELEIVAGGFIGIALAGYGMATGIQDDKKEFGDRAAWNFHGTKAVISALCPIPGVGGIIGTGVGTLVTQNAALGAKDFNRTIDKAKSVVKKVFSNW